MTKFLSLTEDADRDLINIYFYGLEHFGFQQTEKYSETLIAKLNVIAENPSFGSDYSDIRPHLRRYESVSHAIYYKPTNGGILVLRILHSRMDPARHL